MGISDANMEKGQMRVEVNISISPTPVGEINKIDDTVPNLLGTKLGTKVEVKNINSFKAAGKAIEYEFARQSALLDAGEKVKQETRGWDENKQLTFSQRSKENSDDYRYFPDPDIPKFKLSEIKEFTREEILKTIPETPAQKRVRLSEKYGLKAEDIENYVFNREIGAFFEEAANIIVLKSTNSSEYEGSSRRTKEIIGGVQEYGDNNLSEVQQRNSPDSGELFKILSNYMVSDITGITKGSNLPFPEAFGYLTPLDVATVVTLIRSGDLSSRGAKELIKVLYEKGTEGASIKEIAEKQGLIQKSDPEELKKIITEIVEKNPDVVTDYKSGNVAVFQFFVGQAMKATKGAGNPEVIKSIITDLLK